MLRKVCLTLFVLVIGGGAWLAWWTSELSLPLIARESPSGSALDEVEFDRRIKRRFPIGTPEAKLVSDLDKMGFKLQRITIDRYAATITRPIFCGGKNWTVF
jgi:hypothetical protein